LGGKKFSGVNLVRGGKTTDAGESEFCTGAEAGSYVRPPSRDLR